MVIKSSRFLKTVTVIVTAFVLVFSTQLSSFAVYIENHYKYNDNKNFEIIGISSWSPKGEITIPSKATAIKSGAFYNSGFFLWDIVNVSKITKVIIPESVRYIESRAFTGDCSSLKEVVIQNAKSKISVADDAFPSGATVTYTVQETTQPPITKPTVPTTKPPATTQAPTPTTTTTAPSTTLAPTSSKNEVATSKDDKADKAETTKSPSEDKTTAETTTQPSHVVVNENYIPLADIKNEGYPEELDAWKLLVNSNGDVEQSVTKQVKQEKEGPTATTYAVSASAVLATFTTIILTYFKFKK